jgi:hypothetical protein
VYDFFFGFFCGLRFLFAFFFAFRRFLRFFAFFFAFAVGRVESDQAAALAGQAPVAGLREGRQAGAQRQQHEQQRNGDLLHRRCLGRYAIGLKRFCTVWTQVLSADRLAGVELAARLR